MKEYAGKIRRHTYSVAQLREQSLLRSHERELGARAPGHWDGGADDPDPRAAVNFKAWSMVALDLVGWDLCRLPEDVRTVGFAELAMALAGDPRGFALLTGADRGAAGLEGFRRAGYDRAESVGEAFSFCLDETTYTAFENPQDDCRSSMAFMLARDGNWCENTFEPVAVEPQFRRAWDDDHMWGWPEEERRRQAELPENWRTVRADDERAGHADLLDLLVPGTQEPALCVGTSRSDSYYPCFVGHLNAEALGRADGMGVALAYELEAELAEPVAAAGAPRRRSGL